ncbi:MAG: ABC transporter ATP-binding protein [Vallitalea sp.]|jgi:iron complex transport system ATP-binding protein|nr:ABC transporter ATP-binding protein [Vallitalea sp.]
MLNIKNLTFSYGDSIILNNITTGIYDGKITTILGANGSGKSTLLNILTKNLKVKYGNVILEGKDVKYISSKNYAKKVAIVHQKNIVPNGLTVERLISYGRLPYTSVFMAKLDEYNQSYVDRAIKLADLEKIRYREMGTLSGGQRQRVFIAMALAQNTKYLLLDEPTTFLDVKYQIDILRLIKRLNIDEGITILMVLHDINQAISYSDEVIGLKNGEILFKGEAQKVIDEVNIHTLYGANLPVYNIDGKLCVMAV